MVQVLEETGPRIGSLSKILTLSESILGEYVNVYEIYQIYQIGGGTIWMVEFISGGGERQTERQTERQRRDRQTETV